MPTPKRSAAGRQLPVASSVRVRFAPSPTGPFHIGNARTALFNWLFARQNNGKFILRIEDTDTERSRPEYEKEIVDGLKWLGLDWDEGPVPPDGEFSIFNFQFSKKVGEQTKTSNLKPKTYLGDHGPYRQSERVELYKKYLEKLLADGNAYYCYCTKEDLEAARQAMTAQGLPPKYSGHCRNLKTPLAGRSSSEPRPLADRSQSEPRPLADRKPEVIRFKTPQAEVGFKDIIRGKVTFDASLFGDIVIAKNLATPLYNFAVVVDDEEMRITHVIRGEDHISNTPKQILLQKALGFGQPEYAHLPLILNPDRSKLSSRFTEVSLTSYREKGYLPEAAANFLALLGWHPKEEKEVFALEELVAEFDLKRVQKAGAVFNQEKLDWLQKEHLKSLSTEQIANRLAPVLKKYNIKTTKAFLEKIVEIERPRVKSLSEFMEIADFFFKLPDYDPALLIWNNAPAKETAGSLEAAARIIGEVSAKEFSKEKLASALAPLIKERGRGEVLWPLRAALSGKRASPGPLEIAETLGLKETLARISKAIAGLKSFDKQ